MNSLIPKLFILAIVAISVINASEQHQQQQQQAQQISQQQQQQISQQQSSPSGDRQGRSVAGNGSSANNLNNNGIEYSTNKARIELERRQVAEFFTPKNVIKQIMKLLIGSQEEISATSRNVLGILTKVLDLLKNTFGQRSRSGSARTIRDSAEDAAAAGVTMLQGYVKSVLANDERCVQRYLCQASREAVREGKDLGYMVATVGGYASSYLLENSSNRASFKDLHVASMKGKQSHEDCAKLYPECSEQK